MLEMYSSVIKCRSYHYLFALHSRDNRYSMYVSISDRYPFGILYGAPHRNIISKYFLLYGTCCTRFSQVVLGSKQYVEKPTRPVFRFNLALELEGDLLIIMRLCLTLFTLTGQQPMKNNGQIYDLLWLFVNDCSISVYE